MKRKPPEHAHEEGWIVSYADLVTLMMSFFVVLYALKQGGPDQQLETTVAIKEQFGWEPDPLSQEPMDVLGRKRRGIPNAREELNPGNNSDPSKGANGSDSKVETIRAGKEIVTGGKLTFDSGQTALSDTAREDLKQIATRVRGLNNVLMVKGHVSADELSQLIDDPNGMALSFRRATVICDELTKLGIDRRVLRPIACGAFEPIKTGVYDPASLRLNRRAEIYTTDYTASEFFPINTVAPASSQAASAPEPTTSKPAPKPATKPAAAPAHAPAAHH
jgi:chemotaxis protein MotB